MRKSYYKFLLLALATIMLCSLTLLTACGGKETDAESTKSAQSASPSTSFAPSSTPSASGSASASATASPSESPTEAPTSSNGKPITDSKADYKFVYGSAVIDGTKDEAWDDAQEALLDYLKIDNRNPDTEVIARAMWDEKGLYFSFEIIDSNISAPNEAGDYNNDSIYLYIDEDQIYTYDWDSFVDGAYQFALLPDGKELIPRRGEPLPSKDSYEFAYKKTNDGMFIEFFYKPTHAKLEAGTEMFMDFQYNDCTNGTRDGALGWYNDTDNNAISELWGIAQLIAKEYAVKQ